VARCLLHNPSISALLTNYTSCQPCGAGIGSLNFLVVTKLTVPVLAHLLWMIQKARFSQTGMV
jgi:hypothetical protein